MVVAFDLWLIFCCGMYGFDGGGGGDGFAVVGMGSLWWRWLWFLVEFGVYRSDLGGLDQIGWRLGS